MSAYLSWSGAELEAGWQGIELLTMDTTVPGWAAVVTVHLARPASGLTTESFTVEGGRRIFLSHPEISVVEGSQTAEIRFAEKGDHSPYAIRLVHGGNDPVHPFFAEARFRFYLECETGDCRKKEQSASPAPAQPPSIDARNKDFRGFMRMLSEWVRVTNPDWADLAPASLERLLLELLAHHGDMLSHYQDRVANEAFLPTASQRYSLRQHATLLGCPIFEGEAARAMLAFETSASGYVPKDLSVENRRLQGERPVVFYVRERTRIDPANNSEALRVAAWPGAISAAIPAGATQLLLWGQNNALLAGMPFAFVQGNFSRVATLSQVRLIELPGWVADPTDPPNTANQPLTEITFDPPLPGEIRPWDFTPRLRLYANLAEASHGRRRVSWIMPAAPPAPGQPQPGSMDVRKALKRHNSIVAAVPRGNTEVLLLRALEAPEGPVIHERAGGRSVPVIDFYVADNPDPWSRKDNLHRSQSFETHYVAVTDNTGRLWLEFGDGVRGHEIEVEQIDANTWRPLAAIRMEYRVAEPLDGNCALGALTEVVQPVDPDFAPLGVTAITNVTPGTGGKRKDTLDEIRQNVPMSLRHGELRRAVALSDYAAIARKVPGVSRAAAKALGGPFNSVAVLIDAEEEAGLSRELRQKVWNRIAETRMAGREHFVFPAEYVPLRVVLVLCVEPGFQRHQVRDRALAELRPGTERQPGYFHPDKLTFGQDIESGDLLAFVQSIPGVRSVKVTAFCRLDAPPITLGPPPEFPVESRIELGPTEVARMDADENFPENGVLDLSVVGLDRADEALFEVEIAEEGGAP